MCVRVELTLVGIEARILLPHVAASLDFARQAFLHDKRENAVPCKLNAPRHSRQGGRSNDDDAWKRVQRVQV